MSQKSPGVCIIDNGRPLCSVSSHKFREPQAVIDNSNRCFITSNDRDFVTSSGEPFCAPDVNQGGMPALPDVGIPPVQCVLILTQEGNYINTQDGYICLPSP